jgi:hypothetical protein
MKNALYISLLAVVVGLTATTGFAQDACYADYKAKRVEASAGQLELHYGVARVDGAICGDRDALADNIAARIAVDDWTLLRILSTFSQDKLEAKRADAADYFLRY